MSLNINKSKILKIFIIPLIAILVFLFYQIVFVIILNYSFGALRYKNIIDKKIRDSKIKEYSFINSLEMKSIDLFLSFKSNISRISSTSGGKIIGKKLPKNVSKDIVIVSIDEKSLNNIGRWPFRRYIHGNLTKRFTDLRFRENTLFFDIFFTEPDTTHPEDDLYFLEKIKENKKVVLDYIGRESSYSNTNDEEEMKYRIKIKEKKMSSLRNIKGTYNKAIKFYGLTLPLKPYIESVEGIGFANAIADSGKIVRKYPTVANYIEKNNVDFLDLKVGAYADLINLVTYKVAYSKKSNSYYLITMEPRVYNQREVEVLKRKKINKNDLYQIKVKMEKFQQDFQLEIDEIRGKIISTNSKITKKIVSYTKKSKLEQSWKEQIIKVFSDEKNLIYLDQYLKKIIESLNDKKWKKEVTFFTKMYKKYLKVDRFEISKAGTNEKISLFDIVFKNKKITFEKLILQKDYFIKSIITELLSRYYHVSNDNIEVMFGKEVRFYKPLVYDDSKGIQNKISTEIFNKKILSKVANQDDKKFLLSIFSKDLSTNYYIKNKKLKITTLRKLEKIISNTDYFLHTPRNAKNGYISIPIDKNGLLWINFAGRRSTANREKRSTFEVISYDDLAKQNNISKLFTNNLVLVGAFAKGMAKDTYQTPLKTMFGIEIIANSLNTVIMHNFIKPLPKYLYLIILFIIILTVGYIASVKSIVKAYFYTFLFLIIYYVVALLLFYFWNITLQVPSILVVSVLSLMSVIVYRIFTEERQKKKIKNIFTKYVNPDVVEDLLETPPELGGVDKELSVFFSDIRSFTTLSESLTPQDLVKLLNKYLTKMTDILMANKGTLDKYIGDAIMCFWGAPKLQPNHAELACRTALQQMQALQEINTELPDNLKLNIGIGINSGIMTVGNMGSEGRMNYTLMGDNVNLGSRLEGTNKMYKTNIIISDHTYEKIKDKFITRELDIIKVKGKKKPVRIYELIDYK